ncbi:hypothetical protein EFS00_09300 [Lactobacillus amylovorus]|nr:hypothetical protein [Lactobacillus amylovorus]
MDTTIFLYLIVKQKRRSYDRPQFCELIGLLVLNTRHRVSILVLVFIPVDRRSKFFKRFKKALKKALKVLLDSLLR